MHTSARVSSCGLFSEHAGQRQPGGCALSVLLGRRQQSERYNRSFAKSY
jgi:hypothetical protein